MPSFIPLLPKLYRQWNYVNVEYKIGGCSSVAMGLGISVEIFMSRDKKRFS